MNHRDERLPPTRWELAGDSRDSGYVQNFTELFEADPGGTGDDGEARLADVLAPRGARVLDAGSGLGRVAESLRRRGHDVTAVEKDPHLVALSRERFPEVPVVESDLLALDAGLLRAHGAPAAYDVVVVVGNVMVYLAEGTEVRALRTLAGLLADGGCVLVGFHPVEGPAGSRDYPVTALRAHAAEAGLRVETLAGGYDLRPPSPDYVVAVLRPRLPASAPTDLADAECAWLTTLRRDGSPHTTPVWYVVREDVVWVASSTANLKVRNLQHDPRCSLAVDGSGHAPWVAQGDVVVHDDPHTFPEVLTALSAKYRGWDPADPAQDGPRVLLQLRPERWLLRPDG